MRTRGVAFATLLAVGVLGALGACKKSEPEPPGATEKIVSDNQTLAEANAAAGEVVRAAGDCDAVKAALPGARQRLSEIEGRVKTETGRTTFAAVKKRVEDIATMCP
jgi:hypothetical protein